MNYSQDFSEHEDYLMDRYDIQPVFWNLENLTNEQFNPILLQASCLSFNFVPWYVRGMLGMRDPEAKEVSRQIILEEMGVEEDKSLPNSSRRIEPMHTELLLYDFQLMGISPDIVLSTKPTASTQEAIQSLNNLIPPYNDPDYDLRTMVAYKLGGETLVAKLYGWLLPQLERRYGLTAENSKFYVPHYVHDRKDSETGTHTHAIGKVLERLIDDKKKLKIAKRTARKAFEARAIFSTQFKDSCFAELDIMTQRELAEAGYEVDVSEIDTKYFFAEIIRGSDEFGSDDVNAGLSNDELVQKWLRNPDLMYLKGAEFLKDTYDDLSERFGPKKQN